MLSYGGRGLIRLRDFTGAEFKDCHCICGTARLVTAISQTHRAIHRCCHSLRVLRLVVGIQYRCSRADAVVSSILDQRLAGSWESLTRTARLAHLETSSAATSATSGAATTPRTTPSTTTRTTSATTIRNFLARLVLWLWGVVDKKVVQRKRVGQNNVSDFAAANGDVVETDGRAALDGHFCCAEVCVHLRRD